jgi:hypothetical protein
MLGITACINKESNERNVVSKTQPLADKKEVPEYVMTKEVFQDEDGEVYGTVKYSYDDRGNLLQVKYINQDGEVIESKEFEYNDQGLRTKRIVNKAMEAKRKEDWRFDSYDRDELSRKTNEVWHIFLVGWPIWDEGSVTTYKYNKWGQLVSYKKVKEDGTKVKWGGIEYYENGNRKRKWVKNNEGAKKEIYFNQAGKRKRRVIEHASGRKRIGFNHYNENGKVVKEVVKRKNSQGGIINCSVFKNKYNNKGQLMKTKIENKNEGIYFELNYEYNENGNKIRKIEKNDEGEIESIVVYKYNNEGKRIFYGKKTGNDNYFSKAKYKYNRNHNKIRKILFLGGKVEYKKRYYYEKLKEDK